MGIEALGSWVSVALVVPRNKLPDMVTLGTLRAAVPALRMVLDDATLEVVVVCNVCQLGVGCYHRQSGTAPIWPPTGC